MKKLILILIVFISAFSNSYGQTNVYHSFPDSYFWRIDWHCYHFQSNCDEDYYYNYYFDGDTIINSDSYKKIMRDSVIIVGNNGPPCLLNPYVTIKGYVGALKEDSILNKVFFIPQNSNTITLLYDYNLVLGDTLRWGAIITSVDTILIDNQYRKKWNFNNGYIIHGIGSSNGLIEPINYRFCQSILVCVRDISSTLFTTNYSSNYGCHIISSGLETKQDINLIQIYPNPFSIVTTLQSDKALKSATLTIYNTFGQRVKQIENISGQTISLQRDNLASGIYFIRLIQDNKVLLTNKIIISGN